MIEKKYFLSQDREIILSLFHAKGLTGIEDSSTPVSGIFLSFEVGEMIDSNFIKIDDEEIQNKIILIQENKRYSNNTFLSLEKILDFDRIYELWTTGTPELKDTLIRELHEVGTALNTLKARKDSVDHLKVPSSDLYMKLIKTKTISIKEKGITKMATKKTAHQKKEINGYSFELIDNLLGIKTKLLKTKKISTHEGFIRTVTKLRGQLFDFKLADDMDENKLWKAVVETLDTMDAPPPYDLGQFTYTRNLNPKTAKEYLSWAEKEFENSECENMEEFTGWVKENMHKIFSEKVDKKVLSSGIIKSMEAKKEIIPEIPSDNPSMVTPPSEEEGLDPFGLGM